MFAGSFAYDSRKILRRSAITARTIPPANSNASRLARRSLRGAIAWCAAGVLAAGLGGCVHRRLLIRSEPSGARVFVDGAARGRTPATIPFRFYGTREVAVRLEGRHVVRREVELDAPWYQRVPGVDLIAEVLLPIDIEDDHEVLFVLPASPQRTDRAPGDSLAVRAERALEAARLSRRNRPDASTP